jgi:hypothetical protein
MATSNSKNVAQSKAKMTIARILQAARASTPAAGSGAGAAGQQTGNGAGATAAGQQNPHMTVVNTAGSRASHRRPVRKAVRVRPGGFEHTDVATECGMAVPIGPATIDLLSLAYRASVPVLLIGAAGVGKSQVANAAAAALGIECVTRDLSLMEPTDLVGLPKIADGVTT